MKLLLDENLPKKLKFRFREAVGVPKFRQVENREFL
jgi:hypothetical protein